MEDGAESVKLKKRSSLLKNKTTNIKSYDESMMIGGL